MSTGGSGLGTRVATGLAVLSVSFALIWVPGLELGFALLVAVFASIGLYEYYGLARARSIPCETAGGTLAGTLVAASGTLGNPSVTCMLLFAGCSFVAVLHVVRGHSSVAGLASSTFGVVYVGWFAAHVLMLHRNTEAGPGLVTVLIVVVALTDTAAYFVGRFLGKHKLAPVVSPNKTWEGAAGGFVFTLAAVLILHALRGRWGWNALPDWSVGRYLAAGALLSIASQAGDLAESSLKRDAGAKDSGTIFPGHGGVLDRCDGFLFAAPVLYYMSIF